MADRDEYRERLQRIIDATIAGEDGAGGRDAIREVFGADFQMEVTSLG